MNPGGRSRSAALALFAGVVICISALFVLPAGLYWSDTGNIIDEARATINRKTQHDNANRILLNSLRDWEQFTASGESGFITAQGGETPALVLEQEMRSTFNALSGTLRTATVLVKQGPRRGVDTLEISAAGILPRTAIGPVLTRLESEPPFIIISDFEAAAEGGALLKVKLTGSAYRLSGDDR